MNLWLQGYLFQRSEHSSGKKAVSSGPCYKSKDIAAQRLNELTASGIGHWVEQQTGKQGGRPTRYFQLAHGEDIAKLDSQEGEVLQE